MGRITLFAVVLMSVMATPARAECGKADPSIGISDEANDILTRRYIRQLDATEQIDRETAQMFLERIFDPESGKEKNLPSALRDQYRRDARYFSELLKKEAAEATARADAVFAKAGKPCAAPSP